MMRQLLIIALISGVAFTVPSVQAAKKEKGAEQAEGEKKEKKPKKEKKEKKEKGEKKKPSEQSLTGTLSEGKAKGDKKAYVLETEDGKINIKGKKAQGLAEYVGKKITLACKGTIVESKKGKSLMIAKLGEVSEAAAE